MAKKGERKSILLEEAIDASIEFEELMDKTDFDSWLKSNEDSVLKEMEQELTPFNKYKKNEENLSLICKQMKQKGNNKFNDSEGEPSLEKYLTYNLFEAKKKRVDARIAPNEKIEKNFYEETRNILIEILNIVQKSEIDNNRKKFWLILIYNDLSICYAGLGNSYMSRGYAEEASKIIEEEKSYKEFCWIIKADNSSIRANINNHDFVSSKLYVLFTVVLYNQAVAEKRSYLYTYAEKDFKRIIEYAEKEEINTPLRNFNYYSALLNLSELYIDLGRGKEAIDLLDKALNKLDADDIRHWNVYIAKINAFIDQSEFMKAEELLEKFFKKDNELTLNERHKVTYAGFKGLNCFVRCKIEKYRNNLKRGTKENEELEKAEKIINNNIDNIIKRTQEGFETKAYKHLSEIYEIINDDRKTIKNLIKFISKKREIDNLEKFTKDERKMDDWIDKCDDLNVLESFADQIIKVMKNSLIDKYRDLLEKIGEKIIQECDEKNQLFRLERFMTKKNEVLEKENCSEFLSIEKTKYFNCYATDKEDLNKEDIKKRLDFNEKEFDSVLFERSEIKKEHMLEVIVLRRWNSFSPGLFRESTGSLGGGYLIRINKNFLSNRTKRDKGVENIVIDPGYNFLQNFRSEGFYINDIDTIIVTHSHLDHCAELLPIMDLIHQVNKRNSKDCDNNLKFAKKVTLCLSQGAYKKFSSYTDDPDWQKHLKDVIIIENLKDRIWEPFKGCTISAIRTPHMDLGGVNAIGLKFEVKVRGKKEPNKIRLGFTNDTPWCRKIKEKFNECDLLCVHLGSIKYQEIGYTDQIYKGESQRIIKETKRLEMLKEAYSKSNHLLFFGTEDVIKSCVNENDNKLFIISEFGEELKYGLRTDLCKKLHKSTKAVCIPGDIGLYIGIVKNGTNVLCCNFCEKFVGQEEIETFSYGREDAIHYICRTCNKTLSELQKQLFIEHRLTRH